MKLRSAYHFYTMFPIRRLEADNLPLQAEKRPAPVRLHTRRF
jgi:hypothetical protein